MEFSIFYNDTSETSMYLSPGEVAMFSQYGQLLILNQNDDSLVAIPKEGKYVIVFESDKASEFSTEMRFIY